MYTLNIMVKTEMDRTEEEFFFTTLRGAYAKIAEFATSKASNPTDDVIDFRINRFEGTLPENVQIYE